MLVVSDSHLSARASEAGANWEAAAAVARHAALVIHAGDLTLEGAEDGADFDHARRLLDSLGVPWFAVPGNHDVGDNPGTAGPVIDGERLDRWRTSLGPDRWTVDVGDWTVVGINAQLLDSGLDAEGDQWVWLEQRLGAQPPGRPVMLVTHKPLGASDAEMAISPTHRFVPASARRRLDEALAQVHCPVVVSGHVHQSRVINHDGRRHIWAPSTWAVLSEAAQRTVGLKRCGVLSLGLGSHGWVRTEMVEPAGLAQLTLGQDVPDPYHS